MLTWIKMVRDYLRCQKGQGMVEYGLILAVIAVAVVGAFITLGGDMNTKMGQVTGSLNGTAPQQ